jgi:hypothetical protein
MHGGSLRAFSSMGTFTKYSAPGAAIMNDGTENYLRPSVFSLYDCIDSTNCLYEYSHFKASAFKGIL